MNETAMKEELLDTLKLVKRVMDSSDYSLSFDDLYDQVTSVIEKYEENILSV